MIRKQYRRAEGLARIRAERAVLQRLPGVPGVPQLAEPVGTETGATLTMTDAGVHAAGVLHQDLSPGNVLVRPDGTDPLVTDYLALAPVSPSGLNPAVPATFSAILLRLLEKEPDRRRCGATSATSTRSCSTW